jgi:hypothetical protein
MFNMANYSALNNYNVSEVEAQFAWEDIHFGYQKAPGVGDGIAVNQSIIAQFTDGNFFWAGVFGLDPRPTNLSDLNEMNNPQTSVLDRLKKNSAIPSRSWAYTAGSKYGKPL